MTDHRTLLADYVSGGSEDAFRELVACYVDLVYSTALRLVNGDTHRAEDVTQMVFADLARSREHFPKRSCSAAGCTGAPSTSPRPSCATSTGASTGKGRLAK